jgi:hypothetical protein
MANITTQEPIKWQIDRAVSDLSGFISIPGGLNCAVATSVDGLVVSGTEPAGTTRKIGFTVDGALYKLGSDGSLVQIASVEDEGNTVAELAAITPIPGFAGKSVGVAVYLHAEDPDGEMPTFGIKALGVSSQQQTVKTEESTVYSLGDGSQIIRLDAGVASSAGGSAVVEARIDGGAWGTLSSFAGLPASTVQFRATLTAHDIGVSSASVSSASVLYRAGSGLVAGVGDAEIVSVTRDWHIGVRECRMNVRHKRIADSAQKAFVSFRDNPQIAAGEQIGTGTGETGTYQLANAAGIKYDSVRLYFDGTRVYSGYEVNTAVGRITCAAPAGALITADYEHGWALEEWNEMTHNGTTPALDYDVTEYKYALPYGAEPKSVCTVKIVLEVTAGHTDGEEIGAGAGVERTYALSRAVKDGKITVYADSSPLPASAWTLSGDARAVRAVAASGVNLTADYDWISETPEVSQFIAVFAE